MENFNCSSTTTVDNNTICYVETDSSSGSSNDDGGSYSSLSHDIFLVAWTVVGTCAAIAAYNFYIDYQVRNKRREMKEKEAEEEELIKKDTGVNAGGARHTHENYGTQSQPDNSNTKDGMMNIMLSTNSLAETLAHIEGVEASGNFLSAILSQMWNHMNIAVSNTIKDTLEPTLRELKPVSMHFVRLDLGDVPIKTQNMFIHRVDLERSIAGKKVKQAGIQIDVDVVWDGDCDIMLQATLSKSVKATFGVKKIKLSGRMHILLSPLNPELPIISAVQYGFTNPPDLQLSFSGAVSLLNKVGIVQTMLPGVIQSALAGVLVLPHRLVMPMDLGSYDFLDTYQPPVGMVRVTVIKGRGFQVQRKRILKDIPDVYCKISLGASERFKTKTQYDNLNPSWNETCDFILYDMDQKIYLNVYDYDKTAVDIDDKLGKAAISVRDLFRSGGRAEVELESDGNKNGCFISLAAELFHLSDQLNSLSSPLYEGKNKLCGLATVIVTKASDIPIPKEDAATHVKVVYGEGSEHEKVFYTGTVMDYPGYDALNPMYDSVFHVPITHQMMSNKNKDSNSITFTLIDVEGANGSKGHGELGKTMVTPENLLKAYKHTITKTSPIGNEGAKLEYMISLSGMLSQEEHLKEGHTDDAIDEGKHSVSIYGGMEPSEGIDIRITAVRGRGFHIRKRSMLKKDDVPDLYCNIRLKSSNTMSSSWKTTTIKDDTMPHWNESKDYQHVHSANTTVVVDVFDHNSKGTDGFLGSAEFSAEQLLRKRMMELELEEGSTLTNTFVTLRCIELESFGKRPSDGGINAIGSTESKEEVLVHYHPSMDEGYESTLLEAPSYDSNTPQINVTPMSPTPSVINPKVDIRLIAVEGRGFKIRIKKRLLGKKDIPDVYCKIHLLQSQNKAEPKRWRTATIKDDTSPKWNESKEYRNVNPAKDTIHVDAYDDNRTKDEYLGSADILVKDLLQKETMELELQKESTLTKTYLTLRCIEMGSTNEDASETDGGINAAVADKEEVLVHYHPNLGDEGIESTLIE